MEPALAGVARAAEVVRRGGLVVYPTDTLYALGADALDEKAVEEVFGAKKRPGHMAISVAVASPEELAALVHLNDPARRIAQRLLPGGVTLVLRAKPGVPEVLLGGTGKLGVRIPDHAVALALLRIAGPLTATSANRHGGNDPATVADARDQLGGAAELYLDAGRLAGRASTVVDVSGGEATILREGIVPAREVLDAART